MAKQDKKQVQDSSSELVKIKVLLPLAGKFLLPNDPGQEVEIPKAQAIEIVESGYGEFVK